MSEFKLIRYSDDYYDRWNKFVELSNNGTIFHRLDFLEYHRDKFKEKEHHIIVLKGEHIVAVLPLGIFEVKGEKVAKSPYGGSYGGIVTKDATNYSASKEIVLTVVKYLKDHNLKEITITPPISIVNKIQCDTLMFAYLENGFKIVNSDICSVVSLNNLKEGNELFTSRARNMVRKAIKSNIVVKFNQTIDDFWQVLNITYQKHGSNSTHSYEEWKYLCEKFPNKFWNDVAYFENKPIAGIGHILINGSTDSSFYLCNNPQYNDTQALSLLIHDSLLQSRKKDLKWFDFGTSSVNMVGRENIFRFKESFGATGVLRHTLSLKYD